MADDLIACTKYLLKKYNKSKAVIAGYSIGATISLMAAAKDSSIFSDNIRSGNRRRHPVRQSVCSGLCHE